MSYALIVLMTFFASTASFFLKKASSSLHGPFPALFLRALKTPALYAGGFLYLAASALDIYVLRLLPYSVVIPLGSLTYIFTIFIARLALGEKITLCKAAGIVCIIAGCFLITY